MSSQEFNKTMEYIIQAMREKGYDPYQQLKGYLLENEPGYITRYKDARICLPIGSRRRFPLKYFFPFQFARPKVPVKTGFDGFASS